jgi:hypothetical protein
MMSMGECQTHGTSQIACGALGGDGTPFLRDKAMTDVLNAEILKCGYCFEAIGYRSLENLEQQLSLSDRMNDGFRIAPRMYSIL